MARSPEPPVRRRRRGAELQNALLEAAWQELVETGYAKMTMETVAERADTGVAVLYRRWANKDELAIAALEHYRTANADEPPDTGSLRGDLLESLTRMGTRRTAFFGVTIATVSAGLLTGSDLSPRQIRDRILGEHRASRHLAIYRQAHERGEIDLERIPEAVLAMPYDLVRQDLLMELKALPPERIRTIVDDLTLPLLQHHSRAGSSVSGRSALRRGTDPEEP